MKYKIILFLAVMFTQVYGKSITKKRPKRIPAEESSTKGMISHSEQNLTEQDREEIVIIENLQKIVYLTGHEAKKKIIRFLKSKKIDIQAEARSFLVIRPEDTSIDAKDYEKILEVLKRFKEVIRIESDEVMIPAQNNQLVKAQQDYDRKKQDRDLKHEKFMKAIEDSKRIHAEYIKVHQEYISKKEELKNKKNGEEEKNQLSLLRQERDRRFEEFKLSTKERKIKQEEFSLSNQVFIQSKKELGLLKANQPKTDETKNAPVENSTNSAQKQQQEDKYELTDRRNDPNTRRSKRVSDPTPTQQQQREEFWDRQEGKYELSDGRDDPNVTIPLDPNIGNSIDSREDTGFSTKVPYVPNEGRDQFNPNPNPLDDFFRNPFSGPWEGKSRVYTGDPNKKVPKKESIKDPSDYEKICPDVGSAPPVISQEEIDEIRRMQKAIDDTIPQQIDESCKLASSSCDGKDINPNWPSMQVGADLAEDIVSDLMEQFPDRQDKIKRAATVAVLDTGFDTSVGLDKHGVPLSLDALSASFHKGYEKSGDPRSDPFGHGSPVTGAVVGKGIGISKNLNLKFYRVTSDSSPGVSGSGQINKAIEKACSESDIINVSWSNIGGGWDKIDNKSLPHQEWYKIAAEHGCIISKASGNDGKRSTLQERSIESPYVSVGAVNLFQEDSDFSNTGMIRAPGENIYTVKSRSTNHANSCSVDGETLESANGTSIAAPLNAGVMGQIITVLKIRDMLPSEPLKKIALVKSILFAGIKWGEQTGGSTGLVNALGSVLIANSISKEDIKDYDMDKLINIGKESAREKCSEPEENCSAQKTCEDLQSCTKRIRFKTFVCIPPEVDTFKNYLQGLDLISEKELILDALIRQRNIVAPELDRTAASLASSEGRTLSSSQNTSTQLTPASVLTERENIRDQMNGISGYISSLLGKIFNNMNFLEKMKIMLLAEDLGASSFLDKEKIKSMISANGFNTYFGSIQAIGKFTDQVEKEEIILKFNKMFRMLPVEDQISLINDLQTSKSGFLYALDYEGQQLHPDVAAALKSKVDNLADQWMDGLIRAKLPIAAQDMFFENLKQKNGSNIEAIMESLPQGPISDQKIHLYQYVLSSTSFSDDFKKKTTDLVLQNSGEKYTKKIVNLQNKVVHNVLKDATTEQEMRRIREVLLNNKYAILPSASSYVSNDDSDEVKKIKEGLMKDERFINDFLNENLNRGIENLKNKNGAEIGHDTPWINIRNILNDLPRNNQGMVAEAIKSRSSQLGEFISGAANTLVNTNQTVRRVQVSNLITRILDETDDLKELGMENILKDSFRPLREDILKRPDNYTKSMCRELNNIYAEIPVSRCR